MAVNSELQCIGADSIGMPGGYGRVGSKLRVDKPAVRIMF
jgi:hypothetical protein